MMKAEELTAGLEKFPPPSPAAMAEFLARIPFELPKGFLEFMREHSGAEGTVGRQYLALWPLETIHERNAQYGVTEFAPHLLLFGSDGGGEAYAFDSRVIPPRIVRVPFVGFDDEIDFGSEFLEFLWRLRDEP